MPDIKSTIEELKKLYEKTEKGKWRGPDHIIDGSFPYTLDNAFFLVAARNAFPSLIAEIVRLEEKEEFDRESKEVLLDDNEKLRSQIERLEKETKDVWLQELQRVNQLFANREAAWSAFKEAVMAIHFEWGDHAMLPTLAKGWEEQRDAALKLKPE